MSDPFEEQEWFKFGVAATLSRQYSADSRAFLPLLAEMLERALPEETEISRRGGLFSKKVICGVTVQLGDNRYAIQDVGRGPLQATRMHVVRNIALKTEPVPIETWLADLGAALDERAKTSASARDALQKMVG